MAEQTSSALEFEDILKKFGEYKKYWAPIYKRGQEDVDFVLGSQWPEEVKRQRKNRPCLVENRMLPFVHQVINGIRQARPSIVPKPVDDKADVDVAEILRGIIRNIETVSDASSVYNTAARNSVMASVGWIRIITDYAGDDTFDQEIRLERIANFQSVLLCPHHQRQDGSDAPDAFAYTNMNEEEFKEAYPDAKLEGFPKEGGWKEGNTIRVAEYFYKDYETKTLYEFDAGQGAEVGFQIPDGARELRKREVEVCKVKRRLMSGVEWLGDEQVFPGMYIPLVPVYGFEVFTGGERTFYSLIHQAKDPQRMLNYWRSASTEIVALQPKAPFVGAAGQFQSYAEQWSKANEENFPFLEYDPVVDENGNQVPPPQRQAPPTSSGSLMQEAMAAADAIKASLGMYDASLGNQTNDISGKAIISRQMQGDNATYHFVDNLAVAIRQVGCILINIIPIVYSGSRIVRIMGEDGSEAIVPLNQPVQKAGKSYQVNPDSNTIISFDAGKYDVVVEVGASYATKRQELANAIVEIARVNPEIMNVAGDLFMKSLDVPHAEEIAKRIRATMPPELLGDDLEAMRLQTLTKALNDMQAKLQLTEEALLAKKNNDEFKNSIEMKKLENDTKKLEVDMVLAQAQLTKLQGEGGSDEAIGAMSKAIMELKAQADDVAGAIHVLLSREEGEGTGDPETPENESTDYAGRPDIASAA